MINKTHTSCKDCVFAIYENNTQTSCKIKELDLLKANNKEILEVYDEEKEFFVINNTLCYKKRKQEWLDKQLADADLPSIVNAEIAVKCHIIIIANNNIKDIKKTLKSVLKQNLKPCYITLIKPFNNTIVNNKVIDLMKELTIKWRIEMLAEEMSNETALDLVVPFVQSDSYLVFHAGDVIPINTLSDINDAIHNKFKNFIGLKHNNRLIYMARKVHTHYSGSLEYNLIDKIYKDGGEFLILPIKDIVNNFKV